MLCSPLDTDTDGARKRAGSVGFFSGARVGRWACGVCLKCGCMVTQFHAVCAAGARSTRCLRLPASSAVLGPGPDEAKSSPSMCHGILSVYHRLQNPIQTSMGLAMYIEYLSLTISLNISWLQQTLARATLHNTPAHRELKTRQPYLLVVRRGARLKAGPDRLLQRPLQLIQPQQPCTQVKRPRGWL